MNGTKSTEPTRGLFVKRLRERRQMTQSKLAELAGMSQGAIQQIEYDQRKTRGAYPGNAAAILSALDQAEPLTPQELTEFCTFFPVTAEALRQIMDARQIRKSPGPATAEERILTAVDRLVRCSSPDAAADAVESLARLVERAAPSPSRAALTRIEERDGMTIFHRTPVTARGDLLRPIPAGQGLIDDPNLALAEAAKTAEAALRTAAASQHKPSLRDIADKLAAARSRAGA